MSFDETYLKIEMQDLDSVSNVVKPNKLSKNQENFVAVPYWNKNYESQKFEKQSNFKSPHALFLQARSHIISSPKVFKLLNNYLTNELTK